MPRAIAFVVALGITCAGSQVGSVNARHHPAIMAAPMVVAEMRVERGPSAADMDDGGDEDRAAAKGACAVAEGAGGGTGPDLIFGDLHSTVRYGRLGDLTAYAVGMAECNIGTERIGWFASGNHHPVWVQSAFRLKDGRFEQIGLSWACHAFYATAESLCSPCLDQVEGGQELGVGCSTSKNSAPLNGDPYNLSRRCDINAHTGAFLYPFDRTGYQTLLDRRLQIHDADLDSDLNQNALYFLEGYGVAPDDADAGNGDNNASYRRVRFSNPQVDVYSLMIDPTWQTQREQAAIRAWKDNDPEVVETDIRVPGEGLFILAAKATDLGHGLWHYEYALQNLNSDRSAGSFSVPLPDGAMVNSIGFHDVDYHSGDPYDGTDWEATVTMNAITWATDVYDDDPAANALRFDTLYNFRFDADAAPAPSLVTVGLFKPGTSDAVTATTVGPSLAMVDCNGNWVPDRCDIDCAALGCGPPCGESNDCNENRIPDECEPDCNANGVADPCDIINCLVDDLWCKDCNENEVPDGCEPDCDGDGVPDDCEIQEDADGDGIIDCRDLCPLTTPPNACLPPDRVTCLSNGLCVHNYPWNACLHDGGVPVCPGIGQDCRLWNRCLTLMCREGCLLGDSDDDGDLDLWDIAVLQRCYSGSSGDPEYAAPPPDCALHYDFDEDGDIDLGDFMGWGQVYGRQ